MPFVRIEQTRVGLALHQLRSGTGPPLLLLHGLGERSPGSCPPVTERWPGPIHALDFTGHGDSEIPPGGGYTPEALVADADAAVATLGGASLLGRGLGAYVALLLAGARPEAVRGAILADGPGIAGGGTMPGPPVVLSDPAADPGPPDPFALGELAHDLRPPELAQACVNRAVGSSPLPTPLIVTAVARPPWLAAVATHASVPCLGLPDAVITLGALVTGPA
jgi:pimeloyl-ACP methyl ester carboxylesterase